MNDSATYRNSHTTQGYGDEYEVAYDDSTYYGQLWKTIERDLVVSTLRKLKQAGAENCLDFACGTGRILSAVESVFDDTVGVDVSDAMITVARTKCTKSNIIKQDLTRTGLDDRFDVITSFRFFRNAEESLRNDALRAMREHLSNDGCLVVNTHGNPWSPGMVALSARALIFKSTARTISKKKFERLLNDNGFKIEKQIDYSYLPRIGSFFPRWYRPLMGPFEKVLPKIPLLKHIAESTLFVVRAV